MKMIGKFATAALCVPSLCFALEEDPWFSEFLEFNFRTGYEYSFFNQIDHSSRSLDETIHAHVLDFGLGLTAPQDWNWELELEFADTTLESFGYRSFALGIRKLWWDDVCGDPVSLVTGFTYRDASSRFLTDPSTPYHARANFELHTSVGKEWCCGHYWSFRIFSLLALGQANKGSPWLRGDLTLWGNFQDCHQVSLYGKSYFGFGSRETVNIDNFNGWANIRHQSIDVGGSYRYLLGIYGSLRFDYLHRVYARSYPEHVNFFVFTYQLPFCPI